MSYSIDCLRTDAPAALELLADAVLCPALLPEELEEQKARLRAVLESPEIQLTLMNEVGGGARYRLVEMGAWCHYIAPVPPSWLLEAALALG